MPSGLALPWLRLLGLVLAVADCGGDTGGSVGGSAVRCAAADSLVRLSEFFSRVATGVNADGYFGLALVPRALNPTALTAAAAAAAAGIGDCDNAALLTEFERSLARIDGVLAEFRSAHAASANGDGGYNSVTYRTICRPLEAIMRRRLLPTAFHWRRLGGSAGIDALTPARAWQLDDYDEDSGDACLRDALAARRNMCYITSKCRSYFLSARPTVGYLLSHQMVYWLILVEKSCHERLSDGRAVDESLLVDACRRMYREHKSFLHATWTGSSLLDLALEQAMLCGAILGSRDFFTEATTLLVRRLQSERLGCLKTTDDEPAAGSRRVSYSRAQNVSTGRRLLRDVALEGSCSSHTSGLAAAYFALFLRT